MNNYPLLMTLGLGSLLAFFLYFMLFKVIRWGGTISAVATAALMLLIYVPLSVTHWDGIDVFAIHFAFFMMIPYGLGIINGVHEERRAIEGSKFDKKGMHWIPALIITFFISIAVVDSFFISSATSGLDTGLSKILLPKPASDDISNNLSSQFTGAVSNDLQDEEKHFDNYVIKLKKQRARGWKITGGWDNPPMINQEEVFRLVAKDKSGAPITGAKVSAEFRRSSARKYDKLYVLEESTKAGRGSYAIRAKLPLAGCWSMKVMVIKGDDEHEIKGETEISTMIDGKRVTPACAEGEPDIETKRSR